MPYRNTRRKNNRTNRNKRNKRKSRKTQSGGTGPNTTGATAFSELTTYTIDNTNKAAAATYFTNLLGDKVSNYPKIQELIDSNNTDELTTLKNQIISLYIKEITTVNFNDHLDNVIKNETTLAKLNKLLGGDLCSSDDGVSSDEKIEAHTYKVDPSTPLKITGGTTELEIPLTTVAGASEKIKALWGETPPPGLDKLFPGGEKVINDATGVFKARSPKDINEAAVLITSLYDWKIHNENAAEGKKDITEKFVPLPLEDNKLGIKIKPNLDSGVEYTDWFNGLGINETEKVQIKGIPKPNINDAEHVDDLEISKFKENIKDNLKTIEITLEITNTT